MHRLAAAAVSKATLIVVLSQLIVVVLLPTAAYAQATDAPTLFPTKSPQTPGPTRSPFPFADACNDADDANWAEHSKFFDSDIAVAGFRCAFGVATESIDIENCMRNQFANETNNRAANILSDPFTFPCSTCIGRWTACMVKTCDCIAARDTSTRCVRCSASTCEDDFNFCTGGLEIPPYKPEFDELTQEEIITIATASGAAALVLLAGFGLVFWRRSARYKRTGVGYTPEDEVKRAIKEAKEALARGGDGATVELTTRAPAVPARTGGFGGFFGGKGAKPEVDPESNTSSAGPPPITSRKPFFSVRMPGRGKAAAPPSVPQRDFSAGITGDPTGRVLTVSMPFVGQGDDELTLTTGTKVTVLEKLNEDWVMAKVMGTGEEGMMLLSHLK